MTGTAETETVTFKVGPEAPVPICQLEDEFSKVLTLYRTVKPARVLEIGTASGGTLYHWLTADNPNLEQVVSVDWKESGYDLHKDLCAEWVRDGVRLDLVQGDSHKKHTIAKVRAHAPFDWLFIDGAHTFDDCKQDWENYSPMVTPGGHILLHDIALVREYEDGSTAGVAEVWRAIQAAGAWTAEIRADRRLVEYGVGVVKVPG